MKSTVLGLFFVIVMFAVSTTAESGEEFEEPVYSKRFYVGPATPPSRNNKIPPSKFSEGSSDYYGPEKARPTAAESEEEVNLYEEPMDLKRQASWEIHGATHSPAKEKQIPPSHSGSKGTWETYGYVKPRSTEYVPQPLRGSFEHIQRPGYYVRRRSDVTPFSEEPQTKASIKTLAILPAESIQKNNMLDCVCAIRRIKD